MYKTVRHGENSLQYTILPQTEEVLSNSGLKGKGRDYSPSIHIRRSRRKSTVKYVLLMVFGFILALALATVLLNILNSASYARRQQLDIHDVITNVPLTPTARDVAKSRKKELQITPDIFSTLKSKIEKSSTSSILSTESTITSTVASDKNTFPLWTIIISKPLTSSTTSTVIPPLPTEDDEKIPLIGTPSGSIRLLDHYMTMKHWEKDNIIQPTVASEPITLRNVFKHYSRYIPSEKEIAKQKSFEDFLITSKMTTPKSLVTSKIILSSETSKLQDLKDTLLSVDDDDEFKESLEVDEVFSLPPLKPGLSGSSSDSDEVTVSKAGDGDWYGGRWPFVDTSSYIHWTAYTAGDNLLLPLLIAALSSVVLVLLLALALRRRKKTLVAAAQMGNLADDLHEDDNTNLLTPENLEEGEE